MKWIQELRALLRRVKRPEALERAKSEPEAPASLRSSIMASLEDEGFRSG
jgi:hypothetical protein